MPTRAFLRRHKSRASLSLGEQIQDARTLLDYTDASLSAVASLVFACFAATWFKKYLTRIARVERVY
jgi:hypothetical protein